MSEYLSFADIQAAACEKTSWPPPHHLHPSLPEWFGYQSVRQLRMEWAAGMIDRPTVARQKQAIAKAYDDGIIEYRRYMDVCATYNRNCIAAGGIIRDILAAMEAPPPQRDYVRLLDMAMDCISKLCNEQVGLQHFLKLER